MLKKKRLRLAVKRSIHFILTDRFSDAIKNKSGNGIAATFTRDFWRFLDDFSKNNDVRYNLRQKLWNVWVEAGEETLSTPFTEGTYLIVSKDNSLFNLELKEVDGGLTTLKQVRMPNLILNDPNNTENKNKFEELWNKIVSYNGNYPSSNRPITASVAQAISVRSEAPMPIVCAAIKKQFLPSELSNGFQELAEIAMPDEVFDESLVEKAIANGVAERIGDPKNFTFKVKKGKYQEWNALKAVNEEK